MEARSDRVGDGGLGVEELLGARDFVRGLARRLLRDEHGAEDVAQGVMAAMLARGARREGEGGLRAYLGGVVRRMVRAERRGAARRAERERLAARPEETPATDAFLAREEWRRRVVEAVLELAPHEREVVLLRFFEDLSPRRIAERLGVPVETVKTRLKRGLERLRARLGKGRERGELLGGLWLLVGSQPGMLGGPIVLGTGALLMQHAAKVALLALVLAGVAYKARRPTLPASEGLGGIAAPAADVVATSETTARELAHGEKLLKAASAGEGASRAARTTARVRLRGRLVDHARFPVAGASLALVLADGDVQLGASDGDGSFEVEAPLHDGARGLHLLAHDGRGAAARRQVSVPRPGEEDALDLGTLVLVASHGLTLQVTDGTDPLAHAPVRVELGHGRALAFEVRTDRGGEARLEHLPRGVVHLAAGDARRGAHGHAFVPEEERAELVLAPLGELDVRVVDFESGRAIAGAELHLLESLPIPAALPGEEALHGNLAEFGTIRAVTTAVTDEQGRALMPGLRPGIRYRLRSTAEGYREPAHSNLPRLEYGAASLEVTLAQERSQAAPHSPASDLRSLAVSVLDAHGEPLVGARVEARDAGNRPLGERGMTDVAGTALLADLPPVRMRIHVARAGESGRGRHAADVDLATGICGVDVVLPARREVLLRFVIDGKPMLPSRFEVHAGSLRSEPVPTVMREDPAAGEVLVELDDPGPGGTLRLAVAAPGFLRAMATVALPADGSQAEAVVELERGALLRVHALRTERGSSRIVAERFDEPSGSWSSQGETRHPSGLRHFNGPGESFVFEGLRAGLWRARESRTGKVSEPVELGPGRLEGEVTLDLESVQIVAGWVEVEDPRDLAQVRVLVLGPGDPWGGGQAAEEPPVGVYVDPVDGSFRTIVPGDRAVELRAWHPWLVPTTKVELRSGIEGLVLRLGPGDELRVALPLGDAERRMGSFRAAHALRIARFEAAHDADSLGEPLEWHHAPIHEGTARVALPRGSWTLWIDPGPGLAPRVVEGLDIEGVRELPASILEPGATLRLAIHSPAGQVPPRIYVHARSLNGPSYYRDLNSRGEGEVALRGLGAGRFAVRVAPVGSGAWERKLEVELDGRSELSVGIELR